MTKSPDILFPLYFVLLWFGVSFFISRMGWHGFAQRYAAPIRPPGESFNCPVAWFGSIFASYNNVVRVVFADTGIYIYPFILFRTFHVPFLIPWERVGAMEKKVKFWGEQNQLDIHDGAGEFHIALSKKAVREFERVRKLNP